MRSSRPWSASMDKIDKFTKKLEHKIARRILDELRNIRAGNTAHLDAVKVKGQNLYRVRIGNVRIKYVETSYGNIVVEIGFRSENTY